MNKSRTRRAGQVFVSLAILLSIMSFGAVPTDAAVSPNGLRGGVCNQTSTSIYIRGDYYIRTPNRGNPSGEIGYFKHWLSPGQCKGGKFSKYDVDHYYTVAGSCRYNSRGRKYRVPNAEWVKIGATKPSLVNC